MLPNKADPRYSRRSRLAPSALPDSGPACILFGSIEASVANHQAMKTRIDRQDYGLWNFSSQGSPIKHMQGGSD